MKIVEALRRCVGFDWDDGNRDKNLDAHDVSDAECEEVFFNDPLVAGEDMEHSEREHRGYVLGQTVAGRDLFVVFTIRNQLVRVISAREMTKTERERYKR